MTTRTKLIRRATGAAVIATSSVLMMATPAHADKIYKIVPEWVDGCPECPMAVNFKFTLPDPDVAPEEPGRIADKIAVATELLMKYGYAVPADLPKNPLTREAVSEYTEAAELAGNGTFELTEDSAGLYGDAGALIADGLTTLGHAARQRDPGDAAALQERAVGELAKAAGLLRDSG